MGLARSCSEDPRQDRPHHGRGAGLRRELAKGFARAGAHVLIADIDAGAAQSVADLVRAESRHAWPVLIDLCDDQQVEALVAKAEALGGPHILVNNAGGWGTGDPSEAR
jgi:NAD(P)-dependent dehydrogenase (short-subunit alcohol dehydrogenase family)